MAAVSVMRFCDDHRGSDLHVQKTPRPKIGLGDGRSGDGYMATDMTWRCDSVCVQRDPACNSSAPVSSWSRPYEPLILSQHSLSLDNFELAEMLSSSIVEPPPSYNDSVEANPPQYAFIDPLIKEKTSHSFSLDTNNRFKKTAGLRSYYMTTSGIDFGDTSNFRQVKKKRGKSGNQNQGANSGDEGNKEGGAEEDNGAGGAGGGEDDGFGAGGGDGGNSGNGGAGDGGGSGGGGGEGGGEEGWNSGKKKKNKKGKAAVDEEEEKKKKEEEEKRKLEEEKKKHEEEQSNTAVDPLSWAKDADANPDDEWGGFTGKKNKKGKKGKTDPVPDSKSASNPPFSSTLDNVDLNLDSTPHLDVDFGGQTAKKESNSGFGFDGWGSNWNTPSKWDFGGIGTGTTDITDTLNDNKDTFNENGGWSVGTKNKTKQKGDISGFDFGNFSRVGENEVESPKVEDTNADDNENLGTGAGSLLPTGSKDKKKKKKGVVDNFGKEDEPVATTATSADPVTAGDEAWSPWPAATTKKDKKKGKKGDIDASIGDLPQDAAPPPETIANPGIEDEFLSFGSKKDKKKGKKGNAAEAHKVEEPVTGEIPQLESEHQFDTSWDFGAKKDKKKTKKSGFEEAAKPEETTINSMFDAENEVEFNWGLTGEKKTKKGKKDSFGEFSLDEKPNVSAFLKPEPEAELEPNPEPEPEPELENNWGFAQKIKKKGRKAVIESPIKENPSPSSAPGTENIASVGWDSVQARKDKNKSKKLVADEDKPATDLFSVFEPVNDLPVEETFSPWTGIAKKDKKNKKNNQSEVKEDLVSVTDPNVALETTNDINDSSWGNDKKKEKKGKKGAATEVRNDEKLSAPPIVPEVPEIPSFDAWGPLSKKEKEKKSKKGKVTEPETALFVGTEPVEEFKFDSDEEGFGSWGLMAKEKKQKEREEREERDRKEREERENEEKEAREKAQKEEDDRKEKSKSGKKGKIAGSNVSSKMKDLMANSTPDPISIPSIEENSTWGAWGEAKKEKKKTGKKDMIFDVPPPVPTPPAQGLTPEPEAEHDEEAVADLDDIGVNGWPSFAPTKAKSKKDKRPAKGEDSRGDSKCGKDSDDFVSQFLDETPGDDRQNVVEKEETPAKVARSFWSGMGVTSTSKSKAAKEKEREKAEEEAKKLKEKEAERIAGEAKDLINFDMDEEDSVIDFEKELKDKEPKPVEQFKKNTKSKAETKANKASVKENDKSGKAAPSDKKKKGNVSAIAEAFTLDAATVNVRVPEVDREADDKEMKNDDDDDEKETEKADSWSFWGATKKTSGKKADEPKREITKQAPANQKLSLDFLSNEPEASLLDDEPILPKSTKTTKTSKTPMMSSKPTVKSSVAERVKAFEKEKEKPDEPTFPPPVEKFEPLIKEDPPLKKASAGSKPKAAATAPSKTSALKKKDITPPAVEEKESSKDSVPGSFPAEGVDDDFFNPIATSSPTPKITKKVSSSNKEPVMDPINLMDFEGEASILPAVPEAPATPPPEPVATKPAKKERAKVVRDGGASWGFWGAPKKPVAKEVKSKDDGEKLAPAKEKSPANGLTRAKSTKVVREKEVEKSSAKSSSSDKEKKPDTRPSKSRGSSFGGFFGGPPPVRSKPVRKQSVSASKNPSRGQPMDLDAGGLPSPPPEDAPEMSTKAAKVMGTSGGNVNGNKSPGEKKKVPVIPDPYPIDDDDMVLVNALENPIINAEIPKSKEHRKSVKSKTKHEVQQTTQSPELADDIVMVEAGPSRDAPDLPSFQDSVAFPTEKPKPLQRSATSGKKSSGKLMGLFGGFQRPRRMSDGYEKSRSKAIDEEEHFGRKRTIAGGNDAVKRVRRDDRRIRRSERPDVTIAGLEIADPRPDEGVTIEPIDDETRRDDEARREARRAKRASKALAGKDAREVDERRATRREAEQAQEDLYRARVKENKERRARKEEEQEIIRQEEKRAKRAARDERQAKEDQAPKDLSFNITEKRSKRRERDYTNREAPLAEPSSRPHRSDRHHSYMDKPLSPTGDLERRPHRSRRPTGERSSRRKSTAPVDDYFDPRNGERGGSQPADPPIAPDHQEPYMHGANDPTSSWVKSQISEPPPPPPLEPSVIDPAPVLGGAPDDDAEDEARRARRRERRQSRYREEGEEVDGEKRRRRREKEVRSSEGSGEGGGRERRKSDYGGVPLRGFENRGFGGGGGGKRGSWFKKIGLQM